MPFVYTGTFYIAAVLPGTQDDRTSATAWHVYMLAIFRPSGPSGTHTSPVTSRWCVLHETCVWLEIWTFAGSSPT